MPAAAPRDYYEVLGIARGADAKAITAAFRRLAMKYHPDRNSDPGAEERFKEIAEAYAVLSDPKKRAEYDARGFAGVEGFSHEDLYGGINFEDLFGGLNFDFGAGAPFEGLFGRRPRGPARGANIETELPVSLERVASGGYEKIRLLRPEACAACRGTGAEDGAAPAACTACAGTGRVTRSSAGRGQMLIRQVGTCPACHGRGRVILHVCPHCGGSGTVEREQTLRIRIPRGIEDGMVLRVPGKGMPGPGPDGPSGDLFVVVRARHDPRFERDGADLLRHETIALTDAVLGTTLEVPTLDGAVNMTVPPGVQPGAVLRIKNKGLPEFGGRGTGQLYVRIHVHVPERLSAAEHELYERLRAIGAAR